MSKVLKELVQDVLDYRLGNGRYDFSRLHGQERDMAALEAWEEIESRLQQATTKRKPVRPPIPIEALTKVRELQSTGLTVAQAVEKIGLKRHHQTVGSAVRRAFGNLPKDALSKVKKAACQNPPNHERNAELIKMRQSGLTLLAIAQKFGITRERVRQLTRSVPNPRKTKWVDWTCETCGKIQRRRDHVARIRRFCSRACLPKRSTLRPRVIALKKRGLGVKEIAKRLRCTDTTVVRYIAEVGLQKKILTDPSAPKKAHLLRLKGVGFDEIATRLGYSSGGSAQQAIYLYRKKNGLPTPNQGRQPRRAK